VLDRVAANDLSGARVLLDWLREDMHLTGGDDPLVGVPFPRFWTKGKDLDAAKMKLAAAAILVMRENTAPRGVSILEAARNTSLSDPEKTNIAFALTYGYQRSRLYEKGLAVSSELNQQYPESDNAFRLRAFYLRASGKIQESDQLAQERLNRIPLDLDAMHQLSDNAIAREDYAKARAVLQEIVDNGKGGPRDLNQIGWLSLFGEKPNESDVEAALKSAQLSNNAWGVLHTLGCVYAEIGKLKEAREVLVQAMDSAKFDEPESDFWYAFGRIAEQAGERESALADYARVTEPENPLDLLASAYRLAQIRIKAMGGPAKCHDR